jgi:outer membrane protein assembly factor BamB
MSVAALDPRTGRVWWREKLDTPEQYVVATPVYHDGLLLVSGLMLRLDPGAAEPRVLWPETKAPLPRIMSHTCIPMVLGEHVFGGKLSGRLVCLEARTGRQVWETDKVTGLKNGATMHLTANADSVLLFTDQGNLIRARLSAAGYQELSRVQLVEPTFLFGDRKIVWSVPAFADRQVFARNDKELVCASLAAKP